MTANTYDPTPTVVPAAGPARPDQGHRDRPYPIGLGRPGLRRWRGLVAVLGVLAGYLLVSIGLSIGAVALDAAQSRPSGTVTPWLFLANNLSLAALWPIAMLLQWALFGVRPGRLSSVAGRFRWGWFGRAALLVVPFWLLYGGLFTWLGRDRLTGLSPDALLWALIILLTTPLQATGEEYGFRGLITRAVGSWAVRPAIALVLGLSVGNLLFMAAHLATDPWLIAYYLVFGLSLGLLSWRTGGLEAGVLIHVVNNVVMLVPAAVFGDMSGAFERGPGAGGPIMLVPIAILALSVPVLGWWARRHGVAQPWSTGVEADRITR